MSSPACWRRCGLSDCLPHPLGFGGTPDPGQTMTRAAIGRAIRVVLVTLLALALGGFLIAWSGIYNVAASRGHWAVIDWLLAFIMRNSVETRALLVETPALDDEDMVLLGANHYRTGCAPCHGAPGMAAGAVEQRMLPPPPVLS